jgi:hypothetical protein
MLVRDCNTVTVEREEHKRDVHGALKRQNSTCGILTSSKPHCDAALQCSSDSVDSYSHLNPNTICNIQIAGRHLPTVHSYSITYTEDGSRYAII